MTLKQKIYGHYTAVVNEKIAMLQQVLTDLKESGANETKSTAGDKHETALAMLQIEQADKREQLKEIVAQKTALEKIDPLAAATVVVNGSLIKTNNGYLFMSIASGKATIEGISVIALSPQSPLGSKLLGKQKGDIVEMNTVRYTIEAIA